MEMGVFTPNHPFIFRTLQRALIASHALSMDSFSMTGIPGASTTSIRR
jgi:hypothetical protein